MSTPEVQTRSKLQPVTAWATRDLISSLIQNDLTGTRHDRQLALEIILRMSIARANPWLELEVA